MHPVLRLAVLLLAIGLAASRLGLVWHELAGHGGTALALGGDVLDVQLFYFAGGWIRYRVPGGGVGSYVAVALGGIALELVVGLALWVGLRGCASFSLRLVRAVGAAFAIHAAWYLAVGTWHGYGDGILLRRTLRLESRLAIAVLAGALAVVLAYAGARAIFGGLLATLPARSRAMQSGMLALALALAGGVQGGLAVAELALRRDASYGEIMRPERERIVAQELARWTAEQAGRGHAPDEATQRARARALAAQHRDWPFVYVLAVLVLAALVLGALRAPAEPSRAIARAVLVRATTLAAGSVVLVIALDAALGL